VNRAFSTRTVWRLATALAFALVVVAVGAVSGAASSGPSPLATARALAEQNLLPAIGSRGDAAGSARTSTACGSAATTPGLECSTVTVPLDYSGQVPGTVALHVEELPPAGTSPAGVMFLIAGGPGQGSASTYDLGDPAAAWLYQYLFPDYTLVAYDDRGTGQSGLLNCPALQKAIAPAAEEAAAATCGQSLGAAASLYSTADHARDLDAVRAALGFNQVGLFGVSYGTKLAMAYALAYPQHVSRILLDSVLPPTLPDPYESNVLQAMPATLARYCSDGSCNGAQFSADVVKLANQLAAKPLVGKVLEANGTEHTKKVDGIELLSVILDADLSPGEAAELPAVVHAAVLGNTQPLLRLADVHDVSNYETAQELSSALYAATVCRDGPFPWAPDTPPAQRSAIYTQAVASLAPGTLGPFGSWAAAFGNADFCLGWPGETGDAPLGTGPLPNVPMMAVSGGFDMRTPTAGAQSVVAQFPQGHLLVVPGVGHSTVTADPSGCAINAVRAWMTTGTPPATCPREKDLVLPVPSLPKPGSTAQVESPKATLATATLTLDDARAMWLMVSGASGTPAKIAGIYSGTLVGTGRALTLHDYSITRGVRLSGTLSFVRFGPPLVFKGTVTVGGPAAAHGLLGVSGASLRGTLGGQPVG